MSLALRYLAAYLPAEATGPEAVLASDNQAFGTSDVVSVVVRSSVIDTQVLSSVDSVALRASVVAVDSQALGVAESESLSTKLTVVDIQSLTVVESASLIVRIFVSDAQTVGILEDASVELVVPGGGALSGLIAVVPLLEASVEIVSVLGGGIDIVSALTAKVEVEMEGTAYPGVDRRIYVRNLLHVESGPVLEGATGALVIQTLTGVELVASGTLVNEEDTDDWYFDVTIPEEATPGRYRVLINTSGGTPPATEKWVEPLTIERFD